MSISPLAARTEWPQRSSTANEASRGETVHLRTVSSPRELCLPARKRLFVEAPGRVECILGGIDRADIVHALFALFLALQELSLPADVAPVALGQHVLALGLHGLPGDDAPADGGLDRDVEHLSRDQLAQ